MLGMKTSPRFDFPRDSVVFDADIDGRPFRVAVSKEFLAGNRLSGPLTERQTVAEFNRQQDAIERQAEDMARTAPPGHDEIILALSGHRTRKIA